MLTRNIYLAFKLFYYSDNVFENPLNFDKKMKIFLVNYLILLIQSISHLFIKKHFSSYLLRFTKMRVYAPIFVTLSFAKKCVYARIFGLGDINSPRLFGCSVHPLILLKKAKKSRSNFELLSHILYILPDFSLMICF